MDDSEQLESQDSQSSGEQEWISYQSPIPNVTSNSSNTSFFDPSELPQDFLQMSDSSKNCVAAYIILFILASMGNLTVFISVYKSYKKTRSRISLLIMHLAVADMIVCFCLIPIEIVWRITIQWYGGTILCKLCQFLRAFGLYLSSTVLICISLDRFYAILYPFKVIEGRHRVRIMLGIAWAAAAVFSAPQTIIFSVEAHPMYPQFRQCVTHSFLKSAQDEKLYTIFSVVAMYFAPLVVIIFTYSAIVWKICRKSRQQQQSSERRSTSRFSESFTELPSSVPPQSGVNREHDSDQLESSGHLNPSSALRRAYTERRSRRKRIKSTATCSANNGNSNVTGSPSNLSSIPSMSSTSSLRKSGSVRVYRGGRPRTDLVLRASNNASSNISRARNRSLCLTIVIVAMFVLCWTPYAIITFWYMFDWQGAQSLDGNVQDFLFIMAVANSCVNPLIYGGYSKNCFGVSSCLKKCKTQFCITCCFFLPDVFKPSH